MNAILALKKNLAVQISGALITISLMIALPFLVHLLPPVRDTQIGAILLPLFYAPLAAVFLFHPGVAILSALLAPYLNHLITGRPTLQVACSLSIEALIFSVVLWVFHRRKEYAVWVVLSAYFLAKVSSGMVNSIMAPGYSLSQWIGSIEVALPGLFILLTLYYFMSSMAQNVNR